MLPDTCTVPGQAIAAEVTLGVDSESLPITVGTTAPDFNSVKEFLAAKPLVRPNRSRPIADIENEIDLAAIEEGKKDPGIPWEQAKGELGL